MKENIIVIYQDFYSKRISRVENQSVPFSLLETEDLYYIDCDEDSVLVQKKLPPDPELRRIMSIADLQIPAGLTPAIAIDPEGKILMQAFVDKEAISLTLEKGLAHYFSRSKNRIWKKGESSNHTQKILQIEYSDLYHYFVFRVIQNKAACHTGYYTCFYRKMQNNKETVVSEKIS